MPKFSEKSLSILATCDVRLQRLFKAVVEHYDCTVLHGHRGKEHQDELHRLGLSQLTFPDSSHNKTPSLGVDVTPYPIIWAEQCRNPERRFYHFAGYVVRTAELMDIPITGGHDWDGDRDFSDQTFMDLVHWELRRE